MAMSKGFPVIQKNNAESILRYGPKGMRFRDKWEQTHSDLLGHFIEVSGCIFSSQWRSHPINVHLSGPEDAARTVFAAQDQLVYVSIYFRQLFEDDLLAHAVNVYRRFSGSSIRRNWVDNAYQAAINTWKQHKPVALSMAQQFHGANVDVPTVNELFKAFLYGAHVLHAPNQKNLANAARLRELLNCYPQHTLVACLHAALNDTYNFAGGVGSAIYQDFSYWSESEQLPPPDIYWQRQLLNPPKIAESAGRPNTHPRP